ncbi:hypothetical protein QFZ24_008023 [Streptomyces phaeochromogenes]|nr:hypothetical protein [Streptomyces phaeochromogenes]
MDEVTLESRAVSEFLTGSALTDGESRCAFTGKPVKLSG